jgi:hypothetical protein
MFLETTAKTSWLIGSLPKGRLQVAPRRKEIAMTLPRKELESLGFEWNGHGAAWKTV